MGGSDDSSNIIELTVEEHAQAHKKLWEQYGKWQDEIAWKALSGMIGKEEILHEKYKQMNKGRIVSAETREKMAQAKRGRKITEEHKKALHEGRRNSKNSEEHKLASSKANIGRKFSQEHRNKLSASRLKRTDLSESARNAGKISMEKYRNDPERQKRFSETMKQFSEKRKDKQSKIENQ